MTTPEFDLLIKNVRVVRPHGNVVHDSDIAIRDGRFALVAPGIDVARAKKVHDGRSRLAFPGVVAGSITTATPATIAPSNPRTSYRVKLPRKADSAKKTASPPNATSIQPSCESRSRSFNQTAAITAPNIGNVRFRITARPAPRCAIVT